MNRYIPDTSVKFTLPAGKYWIGDLCYVQSDTMRDAALKLILGQTGMPSGGVP